MIAHPLAYNRHMKKFASIVSAFLLAALMAMALSACGIAATPSSNGGNSAGTQSTASSSTSVTAVSPDDESYAENHLVKEAYTPPANLEVKKNGEYTDKDHVALYIHTYGTVPSNYVTKNKARKAGWDNTKGNLWDVLPGKSIGGGGFYNDDHMMPDDDYREWFECDIDYNGGYRNSKRIIYSNDGLIYYTDDHYNTFQRLY